MAMNLVDKIPKLEILKVPFGDAAKGHVGTAIGDTLGAVAIRYLPSTISSQQYFPVALKIALAAGFQWKPIKGFVGNDTANITTLLLTYEALASIYNIRARLDSWLAKLAGKALPGTSTSAGGVNAGVDAGLTQDIVV